MAKFLDKKTRVIDFQLTPLGKQKLSIGEFKPTFYQFFDDGILYDSECGTGAGDELDNPAVTSRGGFTESQNMVDYRIKNETQFLESLVSFVSIDNSYTLSDYRKVAVEDTEISSDDISIATSSKPIHVNKFSYMSGLSDVVSDGENINYSPATRLITCQGQITKIEQKDDPSYGFKEIDMSGDSGFGILHSVFEKEFNIPQIDIDAFYTLVVDEPSSVMDASDVHGIVEQTPPFANGKVIKLIRNDPVIYMDEINTELLQENYDIEVFEIIETSSPKVLERKYFQNVDEQIVDGFMKRESHITSNVVEYTENSVEYYFDVLTDLEVSDRIACGCASNFNKQSYYIDTDHDCENLKKSQQLYYDIYGSVTVPEICASDETSAQNLQQNILTDDLEKSDSIEQCED